MEQPTVNVTMPFNDYVRTTSRLSGKGVVLLCIGSFCAGIVVGTVKVSDDSDAPPPPPVIQTVDPTSPNVL